MKWQGTASSTVGHNEPGFMGSMQCSSESRKAMAIVPFVSSCACAIHKVSIAIASQASQTHTGRHLPLKI